MKNYFESPHAMTLGEGKFAVLAFGALTMSVGANLLLFQEPKPVSRIVTSAIGARFPDQNLGIESATRVVQENSDALSAAEIVRGVQRELNTRGYQAGQPDGVAGLVTRAAILAYEADNGFKLTATPSQELLSKIVLGTSTASGGARAVSSSETTSDAAAVIEMVAQALAAAGYQVGKDKTQLSDQTARAIREFELDQKLPESGRISGPLMSRLLKLQGFEPEKPVAVVAPPAPEKVETKAAKTATPDKAAKAEVKSEKAVKPAPRAKPERNVKVEKIEKPAKPVAAVSSKTTAASSTTPP